MLLATAQSPITPDPVLNARAIAGLIEEAAAAGARCVHFPEAALSGYVKAQIEAWDDVDWGVLDAALERVRAACAAHGVWAAVGCNHRVSARSRPLNSLHVIDDAGALAGRYDKRFCSHAEITDWYAAGRDPLLLDIDGIRVGFALCIEVNFPELFLDYERMGADCVLVSAYSEDPVYRTVLQGHAACNSLFFSYAVPANASRRQASCVIGPDGHLLASCDNAASGFILREIDPAAPRWEVPLGRVRPWRRKARRGEIYGQAPEITVE